MQYQQEAGRARPKPGIDVDDEMRRVLTETVANALEVGFEPLLGAGRGRAKVAAARQLAIYLARTRLGLSFTAAGRLFGRDRTTAAYACRRVEDMRDDERLDAFVERLDQQLVHRLGLEGDVR